MAAACPVWTADGGEGPKWIFVGFTRYRDALFTDVNRLTGDAGQPMKVWSRITPAKNSRYYRQIQRDLWNIGKWSSEFKYIEILNGISCIENQIRFEEMVYFNQDGEPIHATREENPQWRDIRPGSLWDSLEAVVCGK